MADWILGHASAFQQGGSQINDQILNSIGAYAQDVWRVNKNLTLNMGVRWEPFITAVDQNGFNAAFVRERFNQGLKSTTYTNAPAGWSSRETRVTSISPRGRTTRTSGSSGRRGSASCGIPG